MTFKLACVFSHDWHSVPDPGPYPVLVCRRCGARRPVTPEIGAPGDPHDRRF